MNWRLGVIGDPIEHSLSPQLHEAGLAAIGASGASRRLQLPLERADELRNIILSDFDAVAITMPLKLRAHDICDALDATATALGVVNSIHNVDGHLRGTATDGPGLIDALREVLGVNVDNLHVVVLGSGGSARAIVEALVEGGVNSIALHGRNHRTVDEIIRRHPNVVDHMIIYRPVDVIINTIPVDSREPSAATMQGVTKYTIAVDVTYSPRESQWLAVHRATGCAVMNGVPMLAYQAARAMSQWWGVDLSGAQLLESIA